MKENPILTVAIPTYNRPGPLEKILIQLGKEKNNEFLILIADDSSTDDVEKVVRKYNKKLKNLRYHKNKNNLGFSGNVCNLYELAETKYIWFLCDDDEVIPGAIINIVKALHKYNPVVAIFNTEWIDSYGRNRMAGVQKDVLYNDVKKLSDYQALMRATYLSIVVVEKRLPIDQLKQTNFRDNIFFQVTLSLFLLSDKFIFCEIAVPIVQRNVGYKYGEFFKFMLVDQLKAVFIINHKFDNKKFLRWSKKQLFSALELYLSQKIGLFTYNGNPTKETIKKLISYYGIFSLFIFSFKIIYVLVPSFILKFIYFSQLVSIHGYTKGRQVYVHNIDRAYKDERKTGFTSYR